MQIEEQGTGDGKNDELSSVPAFCFLSLSARKHLSGRIDRGL